MPREIRSARSGSKEVQNAESPSKRVKKGGNTSKEQQSVDSLSSENQSAANASKECPPEITLNSEDIIQKASEAEQEILRKFVNNEFCISDELIDPHVAKQCKVINIDGHRINVTYKVIFPQYLQLIKEIHMCPQCLYPYENEETVKKHYAVCYPDPLPGKEIYRDEQKKIVVYECCGFYDANFVRRLCLLGRCFIDHKSVQFDVEPFYFYVLYELAENGKHKFVGYFSKQKYQHSIFNLCCLVVLPSFRGKGYGRFLIAMSFYLSKIENQPGGPERPLSDAAAALYEKYTLEAVYEATFDFCLAQLKENKSPNNNNCFNLAYLENSTGIAAQMILDTLLNKNLVDVSKRSRGIVLFNFDMEEIKKHMKKAKNDPSRIFINNKNLRWLPPKGYEREEMLHFPEIEKEKREKDAGIIVEASTIEPVNPLPEGREIFYLSRSDESKIVPGESRSVSFAQKSSDYLVPRKKKGGNSRQSRGNGSRGRPRKNPTTAVPSSSRNRRNNEPDTDDD